MVNVFQKVKSIFKKKADKNKEGIKEEVLSSNSIGVCDLCTREMFSYEKTKKYGPDNKRYHVKCLRKVRRKGLAQVGNRKP